MALNNSVYGLSVHLNNKGAELLSQGKILESRALFIKALGCTKCATIALGKHLSRRSKSETVCYHFLTPMVMEVDSETFIFKRPVQILENYVWKDCQGVVGDINSVLIFNMSLGFHAEGVKVSQRLAKALSGYKIAMGLRKHRGGAASRLLDMALLNNIAQVHVGTSSYESAALYFANMAFLLKHLDKKELDEVELDGFVSGALWRAPMCAHVA